MKISCIIPARFASQRLPGKPMVKIKDTPMIEWVYRRACQVKRFDNVIVATDHPLIRDHILSIGGDARMTPEDLPSGTDRVAQVARNLDTDIVVNLQGDEPLIVPDVLEKVCAPFTDPGIRMVTPVTKFKSVQDLADTSLVRVVIDNQGDALYFTRAVVPYNRDANHYDQWLKEHPYYKHIGIYAYRKEFLLQLSEMPPGKLEQIEKLEQLRVLENGFRIRTVYADYTAMSIDTNEDLININNYVKTHHINMVDIHEKM